MLPIILRYKLRQIHNTLTRSPSQKKLGWLISIAFIVPYYMMLMRSMGQLYIRILDGSGWHALARMVSVNLALVFFFVFVSSTALTLYRMFQAKDLPLLMSLPAEVTPLFWAKLAESLAITARSMILPFPVCLAFVSVLISRTSSPFAAAVFLVGWVGVTLQLTSLSVIVALVLGRSFISGRWAVLLRIVAIVSALTFLLIFLGISSIGIHPVSRLAAFSVLFPTSWLVSLLPSSNSAVWVRFIYGFGFTAATIGCPTAALHLFRRRFRRLWMMSVEIKRRNSAQTPVRRNVSPAKDKVGGMRAFIIKEARVISREPYVWVGLTIPLVLFPVFILFREQEPGTQTIYIILVSVLTTASYSLSCIGREGLGFPLLRALPIRMSLVMRAKLILGCVVNLAIALAFVTALYLAGRSSLNQVWHNAMIAAISSVYLPTFGTALAALFPKFDFTNPMRAASLPGIVTLYLLVLLFGATLIAAIAAGWYFVLLVMIPWAGIAVMLMKIGQNRLERRDT